MSQYDTEQQDYGRVVTPEAVALDFDIAGLGSRIAAAWIDSSIRLAAILFITFAGGVLEGLTGTFLPNWVGVTVMILSVFGVLVVYPVAFEAALGKTPGKMALGLKVVTTEGAPIDFRQAAVRAGVGLFEIFGTSGLVAAISMLLTKRSQRLGDLAAGTMVLRQRHAERAPEVTVFAPPPGAEDYAASLDVSGLGRDEYDTVRSFLTRRTRLSEQSRVDVGTALAGQVLSKLSTQPPSNLTAEGFLTCVAAAYQRRFSSSG